MNELDNNEVFMGGSNSVANGPSSLPLEKTKAKHLQNSEDKAGAHLMGMYNEPSSIIKGSQLLI